MSPQLDGLLLESEESDYAATGFHRRLTASSEHVVEIAQRFLAASYWLEMITCEDRRADLGTMRLVYTYSHLEAVDRHLLLVDLGSELEPTGVPSVEAPSISGVFAGADWLEREVFDMYGVGFSGHPDLKRILLPEDADFHALLKDFGRPEDAPEEDAPA